MTWKLINIALGQYWFLNCISLLNEWDQYYPGAKLAFFMVLSHWDQGNIHFHDMLAKWNICIVPSSPRGEENTKKYWPREEYSHLYLNMDTDYNVSLCCPS